MSTIIIDSGGTSSDWAVIDSSGKQTLFSSGGMNPVTADIQAVVRKVLLEHNIANIDKLYMYGAGCSTDKLKSIVKSGLSAIAAPDQIYIETDLVGAAYALCGRQSGIISILGTGSNTSVYNGKYLTKSISSGGYLLGDEGSGFFIGKELIIRYLRKEFTDAEMKILEDGIQLDDSSLLNAIYSAERPNHFIASFASLLNTLSSETREAILKPIFEDFITKRLLPFGKDLDLGLYFCGSIAFHYQKELTLALNSVNLQLRKIIPKPIEALINFHNEYL